MSIIRCGGCNMPIDTDIEPSYTVEIDKKNNIEQIEVCKDCIIELEEDTKC